MTLAGDHDLQDSQFDDETISYIRPGAGATHKGRWAHRVVTYYSIPFV